ncbi:MAG: hypothetical protein JSU94_14010 [Phycisphaerales bacterium]|nr:MAG: hypothetical protein JSU94_14010 [Phycisphaerales bacterium]
MFKDEADFNKIVGRLKIDSEPDAAHREGLRRRMLLAFKESAAAGGAAGLSWRVLVRSPVVKLAVAAVIIAGAAVGAYRVLAPKEVEEAPFHAAETNGTDPVYTGTPELAPIEINLPKPVFRGTPQDARVQNLEKPLGRPRPPFPAPVGTANVALDKPVSSSDRQVAARELRLITDGDNEATERSSVELGAGAQHVTVDLKGRHEIWAVVVWHYHRRPRVYFDVVVQVADDPDFTGDVRTLFNNDIDNSAGLGMGMDKHYTETYEGKLIDGRGVRARYVRLYSNGNTGDDFNHYTEVEVYGRPVR